MSATRLKIYNDALILCGERTISSLTENREARHLLDHVWDNDAARACLSMAQWKFGMRGIRLDYTTSIQPEFGYQRAFTKPTDWCVTSAICSDEYFKSPLLEYFEEAGYWYADLDELYVRYVSDDSAFGGDVSLWSASFCDYVAAYHARKIIHKLTGDEDKVRQVERIEDRMLHIAKSRDAMSDPAKFPPAGNWVRSRGGWNRRRDGGSRNNLTG